MSTRTAGLLIQIEAWAREELGAQRELARALEELERAACGRDARALSAAGERLEERVQAVPARERRRAQLLARLGAELGVAPGTLTLRSLAERARGLGLAADGLQALREELREEVARVLRAGRRVAAVARGHRALLDDVLRALAPGEDARGRPVLLDARG